jgi:thioredoxin 1
MWPTLIPGILVGATLGTLLGHFKFRSPIAGAVLGACLGAVAFHFITVGPKSVGGVESPEEFDKEVLSAPGPVLVDFYADWCPPCRKLAPTIEALAVEFKGRVKVVKVNVDDARQLAARYGIRSIPTVMVFLDGEPVAQTTGNRPASRYRQMLEEALASQRSAAAD